MTDTPTPEAEPVAPTRVDPVADMCRTIIGDCRAVLATLPAGAFRCCVTSPPYWLQRDYKLAGQIGMEATPQLYVEALVDVLDKVWRVLTDDGTLWLNLGDRYANDGKWGGATSGKHVRGLHGATGVGRRKTASGLPPKCLSGMPWRVALALIDAGWTLRSEIIWHKINVMPEAVKDRPTRAHEHVFLLSKGPDYFYDQAAIREPVTGNAHRRGNGTTPKDAEPGSGVKSNSSLNAALTDLVDDRNARTVWAIQSEAYGGKHYAPFPRQLAQRCVMAGSAMGDAVLDPFHGSGTVGEVAESNGRRWLGIDLGYAELSAERAAQSGLAFGGTP